MYIETRNLSFNSGEREYKWVGLWGNIIESKENNIEAGHLKMVGNVLFYAYIVEKFWFKKNRVCWTTKDIDVELLNDLKKAIFKVK